MRGERVGACRQLTFGLLVVGDRQHGCCFVAPIDDEVTESLGEHSGLAGAGRSDDPRRSTLVLDGGALIVGEVRAGSVGRRDTRGATGFNGLGVDHRTDRGWVPPLAWTTVDPDERPVGESDVTWRWRFGTRLSVDELHSPKRAAGLAGPPPHRRRLAASVVVVRPDKKVEPVEPRLGVRRVGPRLAGDRLRGAKRRQDRWPDGRRLVVVRTSTREATRRSAAGMPALLRRSSRTRQSAHRGGTGRSPMTMTPRPNVVSGSTGTSSTLGSPCHGAESVYGARPWSSACW